MESTPRSLRGNENIFEKSGHDSDTCFDPFVNNPSIVKKIVTDSNVVAQETGLAALNALLEFGGPRACLQIRSQVVGPLVEKQWDQPVPVLNKGSRIFAALY